MTAKIIFKSFISLMLLAIWRIGVSLFEPTISARTAVGQLSNSNTSFEVLQIYNIVHNYGSLVILAIILLIFFKEIKLGIKALYKNINNN